MTVTIIQKSNNLYPLKKEDLVDGHAYKSDSDLIYICNRFGNYIAFSICGKSVILMDSIHKKVSFKEINLEIREV